MVILRKKSLTLCLALLCAPYAHGMGDRTTDDGTMPEISTKRQQARHTEAPAESTAAAGAAHAAAAAAATTAVYIAHQYVGGGNTRSSSDFSGETFGDQAKNAAKAGALLGIAAVTKSLVEAAIPIAFSYFNKDSADAQPTEAKKELSPEEQIIFTSNMLNAQGSRIASLCNGTDGSDADLEETCACLRREYGQALRDFNKQKQTLAATKQLEAHKELLVKQRVIELQARKEFEGAYSAHKEAQQAAQPMLHLMAAFESALDAAAAQAHKALQSTTPPAPEAAA